MHGIVGGLYGLIERSVSTESTRYLVNMLGQQQWRELLVLCGQYCDSEWSDPPDDHWLFQMLRQGLLFIQVVPYWLFQMLRQCLLFVQVVPYWLFQMLRQCLLFIQVVPHWLFQMLGQCLLFMHCVPPWRFRIIYSQQREANSVRLLEVLHPHQAISVLFFFAPGSRIAVNRMPGR